MTITVTNADKLTDFALSKLQHMFDAASAVMPKAIKEVLAVTQMNCLFDIVQYIFLIVILGVAGYIFYRFCLKVKGEETRDAYYDNTGWIVGSIVMGVGTFIFFCAVVSTFPFWSIVGLNHPDLYLIHQALSKVGM